MGNRGFEKMRLEACHRPLINQRNGSEPETHFASPPFSFLFWFPEVILCPRRVPFECLFKLGVSFRTSGDLSDTKGRKTERRSHEGSQRTRGNRKIVSQDAKPPFAAVVYCRAEEQNRTIRGGGARMEPIREDGTIVACSASLPPPLPPSLSSSWVPST